MRALPTRPGTLLLAAALGLAGLVVSAPAAAASATEARPLAAATTTCAGLSRNGLWYCNATLSSVRSESSVPGRRVVLRDVSVTAVTATTVTVAAIEWGVCPPDRYCGGLGTVVSLTVAWTGTARPVRGAVVNLFGTTITRSVRPAGYTASDACHIDWC